VTSIEKTVDEETSGGLPEVEDEPITIRQRRTIGIGEIARTVFTLYPRRTILCFSLFVGQAFLYNAVLLHLRRQPHHVLRRQADRVVPRGVAVSNFIGALLLSRLFDTVGRVRMISGTYILAGVLLAIAGVVLGGLNATTLTIFGCSSSSSRRPVPAPPTSPRARCSRSRPGPCASRSSTRSVRPWAASAARCCSGA
jgi:hypothetical protein